jgi:hypothetical protein
MEKEGDRVIVRRPDGKFDSFKIDQSGARVKVGEAQFPLPYDEARKTLGANQLWLWEAATHRIDLTDSRLADLAACAGDVATLLQSAPTSSAGLIGVLDDLLGAIYELISSVELDFHGKTGQSPHQPVITRAQQLAKGEVRSDGNWMAGFHFNSALFRISALFDRLPKAITCCHTSAAAAYLQKAGKPWDKRDAHRIRKQVNRIKHEPGGSFVARSPNADFATAVAAVKQLLELAKTLV